MYREVLTCLLLINVRLCKLIEIKCPSICKCDIVNNLRRATCNNHNIITIETDVPKEVEIIDLSFNHISQLDDQIFLELEYTQLRLLNLSHNKLSDIRMNAFKELKLLKTMDLSYNVIQYVLPHWFWETPALEELYLNNNYLASIGDDQLESNSLKILDISHCHIKYININAFGNIPNVISIDVSDNDLIEFDAVLIKPLKALKTFNVDNNQISCNDKVKEFQDYCRKMRIKIIDLCKDPKNGQNKFERIMVAPEVATEKNSWMYEDTADRCNTNVSADVHNITIVEANSTMGKDVLTWFSLILSFTVGYCFALITNYANNKLKCNKKRLTQRYERNDYEQGLIEHMTELPLSTPVPQRRLL